MAHPGGRPLKFKSVEELQAAIDKYFDDCDSHTTKVLTKHGILVEVPDPQPYTMSGLANALDIDRTTLLRYGNDYHTSIDEAIKEEFRITVKRAKSKVEEYTEKNLALLRNPAGAIFSLLNNFDQWSNKQELEVSRAPEKLDAAEVNKLLEE